MSFNKGGGGNEGRDWCWEAAPDMVGDLGRAWNEGGSFRAGWQLVRGVTGG